MDQHEPAARCVDHLAHLLAGGVERCDWRAQRHPVVPRDLRCDPADPCDVGLAVRTREAQPLAQVVPDHVAVQARDRAVATLEQKVVHCPRDRRLAGSGQPGEEDHHAAPVPGRTVLLDQRGDVGRQGSVGAGTVDRAVGGRDRLAQSRVGAAVAPRRHGHGDHLGTVDREGRGQAGAHQCGRGDPLGRAGAGADHQQWRGVTLGSRGGHVDHRLLGQWRDDGHGEPLRGRQVRRRPDEATERAELRRGQRPDRTDDADQAVVGIGQLIGLAYRDPGKRQPFRVEQLHLTPVRDLRGDGEGERGRAGRGWCGEPVDGQDPHAEQLEIVELACAGSPLRDGGLFGSGHPSHCASRLVTHPAAPQPGGVLSWSRYRPARRREQDRTPTVPRARERALVGLTGAGVQPGVTA
jgi:hypothetical protein